MPETAYFPLESFQDENSDLTLAFTPYLSFVDILNLANSAKTLKSIFYSDQIWYQKVFQDYGIAIQVATSYLQRVNKPNSLQELPHAEGQSIRITPLHLYRLLKQKLGVHFRNSVYNVHALNEYEQSVFLACCFDDYPYFSEHVPYENIDWWYDWSLLLGCKQIPENLFLDKRIVIKEKNLLTAARSNDSLAKLFIYGKELSPTLIYKLITSASEEFIEYLHKVHLITFTEDHFLAALRYPNSPVKGIGKILYEVDELGDQIQTLVENLKISDELNEDQVNKISQLLLALVQYNNIELFKLTVEHLKSKITNFIPLFLTLRLLRSADSYAFCEYLVEICGIKPDLQDLHIAMLRGDLESFRLFCRYTPFSLSENFLMDRYFLHARLSDELWNEVLSQGKRPDIKVANALFAKNQTHRLQKNT